MGKDSRLKTARHLVAAGIVLAVIVGLSWSATTGAASRLQSPTATLSGTVVDEHDALVPEVTITVTNADTALQRKVATNADGYFSVALLPPGRYSVSAQLHGFSNAETTNLKLNVGDQLAIRLRLKAGSINESIIVEGASSIQTESAAVSAVVDRQFVENLPLNGRSLHALIELTPGTVGQFSVNGQRTNANYFMMDGVGANIGAGNGLFVSVGSVPAFTALGTTSNLVSVDALQEFQIQTSTYAPEFGRSPGAQVSLVSRAGTNHFHGTLFDYFRNDALDATDWFANSRGLKKPPLRQNDFGGVVGGPIIRNQTFFFFSYEGLRLRLPKVGISQVPSLSVRKSAIPQMQPFLNAFPLPNGKDLAGGLSQFSASFSDPATVDATSIRIDYNLGNGLILFGRYDHAPSSVVFRDTDLSLNNVGIDPEKTQTLTLGLTHSITPALTNESRFNYSRVRAGLSFLLNELGGAVPPGDSVLFPFLSDTQDGLIMFSLGSAFVAGKNSNNLQRQINVVDALSALFGAHQFKFGIDYRRLSPISDRPAYSEFAGFSSPGQAAAGIASSVSISGGLGRLFPVLTNLSAYAQDTWKTKPRLTLVYGLRWELNTPPKDKNGNDPFTIIGLDNPATMRLAPKGAPLWETTYRNFAPRFGVAYQLSQRRGLETVLRGGVGLFYDTGTGPAGRAIGNSPFTASKSLSGVPFPLTPEEAAPPSFNTGPPYSTMVIFDPDLKLPKTYQWNVSLEQSLGPDQTISASYVAAVGRGLLRQENLRGGNLANPDFTLVIVEKNDATSDYHALQLEFQRRFSRGLQSLASYTWSHSIDSASSDGAANVPAAKIDPNVNRGPSDFDVRHLFSGALTYDIPSPDSKALRALISNWSVDAIFRARSATPVDVILSTQLFGVPQANRPNLVPGVPPYIDDLSVAGGRRFNRAAFSVPPVGQQGNLGRNSLRGFPASQLDLAFHRRFILGERLNLQLRGDFFNIFNHPNFADPVRVFNNVNFGQSVQMLAQTSGGLSPLYQVGGPRSIQLAMKVQF